MSGFEAWIGNCHLRQIEGEEEYQCQAAVWADSYDSFRAKLAQHIESSGLKILWLEECHPVSQYLHRHGNPHKIGALARAVHPQHHVELDKLTGISGGQPEGAQSYLIIEDIEGVEPLDGQRGVWPEKNIPDMLVEPLFGHVEPTEEEIAHYGRAEAVPPMRTYAILDAGKFQWGFDEIEDCGMPCRCLFKGDAAEELKDVAPYLIDLDPEAIFTRRLFKYVPEMPDIMTSVHVWHKEPGIYIRSRSDFAALWKHFRKFTRVQNEKGEWYYFRFWEPKAALNVFRMLSADQKEISGFLHPRDNPPLFSALVITGGTLSIIKPVNTVDETTRSPFVLTRDKYDYLNRRHGERFEKEFAQKLFDVSPKHRQWLAIDGARPVEQLVHVVADDAKKIGFKSRNEVTKLASFAYFAGTYVLNDPRITSLKQDVLLGSRHKPIRRIQVFEETVEQNNLREIFLSNESLRLIVTALPKINQGGSTALTELVNVHPYLLPRDARADFVAACRDQCKKWRLTTEEDIYAHGICAIVFTPFFMDDPLHGVLQSVFTERESGKLAATLIKEFDRRLAA